MKKQLFRFKRLGSFILFICCISILSADNTIYKVISDREYKFRVMKNGEEYMNFDLKPYLEIAKKNSGEGGDPLILHPEDESMHPISPDNKYIVFIAYGLRRYEPDDSDIILVNLQDKSISVQELYKRISIYIGGIGWISPTRIVVYPHTNRHGYISYDVVKKKLLYLDKDTEVVWDSHFDNYATKYGDIEWFIGGIPLKVYTIRSKTKLKLSDAIRYNSYWIYPERIKDSMIHDDGIAIDGERFVLSTPIFIGDTNWIGFMEQIYPIDFYDKVIESSIVVVDAHKVKTDLPLKGDVVIKRLAIDSIVPKTESEYVDLELNLVAKWNKETKSIEIWKDQGLRERECKQKLIEVPINLETMEFGKYKKVSDYVPPPKEDE